jgi:hypothetical protein
VSAPGSKPRVRLHLWLDGGYDRAEVEECEYHPAHRWDIVRVGDVAREGLASTPIDPDELMVICRGCFVPRCGEATYYDRDGRMQLERNPCMLPRHHRELHAYADGTLEDDSGWPGSDKPFPEWVPRG